jgi:hypothetical protein
VLGALDRRLIAIAFWLFMNPAPLLPAASFHGSYRASSSLIVAFNILLNGFSFLSQEISSSKFLKFQEPAYSTVDYPD